MYTACGRLLKVGVSVPFVGFVTLWKDSYELLNARLFDWELVTCPPVTPTVAEVTGSTLVLNMGPRAGLVLPGETTDGDEEFEIDYDADRDELEQSVENCPVHIISIS